MEIRVPPLVAIPSNVRSHIPLHLSTRSVPALWVLTSSDERFRLVGIVHRSLDGSRAESRMEQRRASSSPSSVGLLYVAAF